MKAGVAQLLSTQYRQLMNTAPLGQSNSAAECCVYYTSTDNYYHT